MGTTSSGSRRPGRVQSDPTAATRKKSNFNRGHPAKSGIGGALDESGREVARTVSRFADLISLQIGATPQQREQIESILGEFKLTLANVTKKHLGVDEQQVWETVCNNKNHTLVIATAGALRLVFNGLFFAFENFCQDCCVLVTNDQDSRYQYRRKKDQGTLERVFGADLYDRVHGGYMETARSVRNALAHRGGLVPVEMLNIDHGFVTSRNPPKEFVIVPADNRRLFQAIRERSLLVADAALKRI